MPDIKVIGRVSKERRGSGSGIKGTGIKHQCRHEQTDHGKLSDIERVSIYVERVRKYRAVMPIEAGGRKSSHRVYS